MHVQRKSPNNACRAKLCQISLILKIQKRAITFYNHLKISDPQTYHHKALTCQELKPEKSPLSQLVLRLCPENLTWSEQPRDHNTKPIRPNQIIHQQKEIYITYWKETTKTQSKLKCSSIASTSTQTHTHTHTLTTNNTLTTNITHTHTHTHNIFSWHKLIDWFLLTTYWLRLTDCDYDWVNHSYSITNSIDYN